MWLSTLLAMKGVGNAPKSIKHTCLLSSHTTSFSSAMRRLVICIRGSSGALQRSIRKKLNLIHDFPAWLRIDGRAVQPYCARSPGSHHRTMTSPRVYRYKTWLVIWTTRGKPVISSNIALEVDSGLKMPHFFYKHPV